MKARWLVAPLALLAFPAIAAAHTPTATVDCSAATFTLDRYPVGDNLTLTVNVNDEKIVETYSVKAYRNDVHVISIPVEKLTVSTVLSVKVDWVDGRARSYSTEPVTLACVTPPPPPTPPNDRPPVTTPNPPIPPDGIPPAPPKPKTCAELIKAGVGQKWLEKRGCVKKTVKCPKGKVDVRIKGRVKCIPLNPPPVKHPFVPVTGSYIH